MNPFQEKLTAHSSIPSGQPGRRCRVAQICRIAHREFARRRVSESFNTLKLAYVTPSAILRFQRLRIGSPAREWTGLVLCVIALFAPNGTWASNFDHSHIGFGSVLQQFVKNGLVDYAALKKDPKRLDEYLGQLAVIPEEAFMAFREKQKIAFLINLYNATTLRLVIDHYPLKSIKDIGNWLNGPFDQKIVRLMGRSFSLGDVEHAILRKNHREPRLHFALVCGALGCPPLRAEAYVAEKLDDQLDDQARQFLATPSKNLVDLRTRTLHLSK